jgi:hypothetical protein
MHSLMGLAWASLGLMATGLLAWAWVRPRLPQGAMAPRWPRRRAG